MASPNLTRNTNPVQARSRDTFELILEESGLLLEEVGFEQFTTNLAAARAEISVPALYRYFPNKYAILRELGDRITKLQDDAVLAWIEAGGLSGAETGQRIDSVQAVLVEILDRTRAFPGSISITRALRAVPALQEIRIDSRDRMVALFSVELQRLFPAIPASTMRTSTKLVMEILTATIDMTLEQPGPDLQALLRQAARAVVVYLEHLSTHSQD